MVMAAATQFSSSPATTTRATRGSTGIFDIFLPTLLRRPCLSVAPISNSVRSPSSIWRAPGGSRKGNVDGSPKPKSRMRKITPASEVRFISGGVATARDAKSSKLPKRTHTPAATRPARPRRCSSEAWLAGSTNNLSMRDLGEKRLMRTRPLSTTKRTPGTVKLLSATLVASVTRRVFAGANTSSCCASPKRPYSGRISTPRAPARPRNVSATSKISRSPGRNARTSPGPSSKHSSIASVTRMGSA